MTVVCPRCQGSKMLKVAILYPNPPARVMEWRCPFCQNGWVDDAETAIQLLAEQIETLNAAKEEIPWLRRRRILAEFRAEGCDEFVVMREKM